MARPTWRVAVVALALANTACARAATRGAQTFAPASGLRAAEVANGFDHPLFLCTAPGDPRLFVVEQPGRIRWIEGARPSPAVFLDVHDLVSYGGESGLLGLAFHPQYAANGWFYVNYTDRRGDTQVVGYTVRSDRRTADPASAKTILSVKQPFANHNGGMITFGPDGKLYYGMGDEGSGDDPFDNGQNDASFFGKMYRIDVDNPPASPLDDVFAKGLRNPWRFSFDRGTGDLYIGDVGQNQFEEIDVVAAPVPAGINYGWDLKEARHCHFESGDPPCPPSAPGLTDPVLEYCHSLGNDPSTCGSHDTGNSVTGGYVYRGCAMPDMQGVYFYGDYGSAFIHTFQGVSGGDAQNDTDRTGDLSPSTGGHTIDAISSFGEDARGEIYVVDYGSGAFDGEVFKIVPGP